MAEIKKLIEAALFMSPASVPLGELARIAGTSDLAEVRHAVEELQRFYNENSALEIADLGDNFQMRVRQEHEENVGHLAASTRFSKGTMKTLAYIAYKQPVKQSQLIKLRTNKAYDEIHALHNSGLISREKSGRTFTIRTTKKFLRHFGKEAVRLRDKLNIQKLSAPSEV